MCCGGYVTFLTFLGKYAYNNPDGPAWYGNIAGQGTLTPTEADLIAQGATDIVDVHSRFVAWFLWGFWQALLPVLSGVAAGLTTAFGVPQLGACLGGLGGCGIGCGGLFWWIYGMVWRFKPYGKFAAGDVVPDTFVGDDYKDTFIAAYPATNQYSSGNFMAVYYLITWIMLGVSCGCTILGFLCTCLYAKFGKGEGSY